jgi:hypothetical protein
MMRVIVRPTTVMKDEREELAPVEIVPPMPPVPPIAPMPPEAEPVLVTPEALAAPPVPPAAPAAPAERLPPVAPVKVRPLLTFPVLVFATEMLSLLPTNVRVQWSIVLL